MWGGWFGSSRAEKQNQQIWIKTKSAQPNQRATSVVLDEFLQSGKYAQALELYDIFINQHNKQTKYALRWAKGAAHKGYFALQYRLIQYYQKLLHDGVIGLSRQDIDYLYELILKSIVMFQLAGNWFEFRCDIVMNDHYRAVSRCVYTQYCNLLEKLSEKNYAPPYHEVYLRLTRWIGENRYNLERVSPVFLAMVEANNRDLNFLAITPHFQQLLNDLNQVNEKLEIQKQNSLFLKSIENPEHVCSSWKELSDSFKNVN